MSAPFAQCGDWGICLAIIQISIQEIWIRPDDLIHNDLSFSIQRHC